MELVYNDSLEPVEVGDIRTLRDNEKVKVTGIQFPHKPSSTGRVFVEPVGNEGIGCGMSYFPSVIGAKWINREDQ
jgi:hypothetical protein